MIYVEPNAGVTPVVQFIEAAKSQLMVNVYYIDDPEILAAIGADVAKGVKVYVQIAGNPYGMDPSKVQDEESSITQVGATVRIAPPEFEGQEGHYSFDHAKYAVSDAGVLIGTANWDKDAFTANREYIYTSSDPALIQALSSIFVADFGGSDAPDLSSAAPSLVISPGAETAIAAALTQPGSVEIEVEELGNDPEILRALESKGAGAEVVIPRDGAKAKVLNELRTSGVQVRVLHGLTAHAKMILGSQYGIIESQNFSKTSLYYNREIGIILSSPSEMSVLSSTFAIDWNNAN